MAGSSNLTQTQLLEALAVLVKNISVPFQASFAETGVFVNGANQIQFPDNAYNQNLGNNLTANGDGTNIYITLVEGNPASGA
jgi:hypothetical protein